MDQLLLLQQQQSTEWTPRRWQGSSCESVPTASRGTTSTRRRKKSALTVSSGTTSTRQRRCQNYVWLWSGNYQYLLKVGSQDLTVDITVFPQLAKSFFLNSSFWPRSIAKPSSVQNCAKGIISSAKLANHFSPSTPKNSAPYFFSSPSLNSAVPPGHWTGPCPSHLAHITSRVD